MASLRNLQRASHRLHNLLEQSATTAAADVEVFDIIVPDGLLIPDLVLVDAAAAEQATANT